MGTIKCTEIRKSFKDKLVLDGINLCIEQGKIYGLIGRNGAGKTTLMSVMTAQTPADSGEVTYDGEAVWENRSALDHICFSREILPNSDTSFGTAQVKSFFEIASVFYPNWDQQMAEDLLERSHIKLKDKIFKLSKGMISMVTIIIGLASGADITILDEPVAGLDVVAREKFYKLVLSEAEKGRTFIISTHIIEEAADIFEEVIFLHNHKILLQENTLDLLDRCFCISGLVSEVDKNTEGLNVLKSERIGRSKSVTVMLDPGQKPVSSPELTVQPVSLQNLFIAMCGEEE